MVRYRCKIVLFNFVHRLNYNIIKLQRFGSWILLPSSGKKGERGQKTYLLGPQVELASDQVWVCTNSSRNN
jgi:hypothetical protein